MTHTIIAGIALALVAGTPSFASGSNEPSPVLAQADVAPSPMSDPANIPDTAEVAVLAGGCFWGMEGVFERLDGVYNVVSGYSGGKASTAHYDIVSSGTTGQAESVEITFDPATISYETLLDVFFTVAHDPTQLNYQGPDHGTQYRSAIFYENDAQRATAEKVIAALSARKVYADPIVTEVTPLEAFYPAESYHQDFMRRNPNYPYIVYWDKPKIALLEKTYPNLLATP